MKAKHNKKRNVGLVYEMLLRYITKKIIESDEKSAKKAIKIIERRFDKNTELYKEFRLFNALASTTVSETPVAAGILVEAKQAARRTDTKKLQNEKSLLIKDINYQLNDKTFFHQRIEEFKQYATIQMLLNEWRRIDRGNFSKIIEYEKRVTEHLLSEKKVMSNLHIGESGKGSDKLVVKIMSEKINEKYRSLSEQQKLIIRNYAIYGQDEDAFSKYIAEVKQQTIQSLNVYKQATDNEVLLSKVDMVLEKINRLPVESIDDKIIEKYLTVCSLKESITSGE